MVLQTGIDTERAAVLSFLPSPAKTLPTQIVPRLVLELPKCSTDLPKNHLGRVTDIKHSLYLRLQRRDVERLR